MFRVRNAFKTSSPQSTLSCAVELAVTSVIGEEGTRSLAERAVFWKLSAVLTRVGGQGTFLNGRS
jgi:hypothetical protein